MKIRSGFVSNSSSASFIVTLNNKTFNEFAEDILSHFWDFRKEDFEEKLKEYIKELELELEKCDSEIIISRRERSLEQTKKILEKLPTLSTTDVVREILMYNGINTHQRMNRIEFSTWTTMFNDISDMGEFMMKLITFMNYRYGNKLIEIEVRGD